MDAVNILQSIYYFQVIGVIGVLACFGVMSGYLSSAHAIPFGGKKSDNQSKVYVSMSCTS